MDCALPKFILSLMAQFSKPRIQRSKKVRWKSRESNTDKHIQEASLRLQISKNYLIQCQPLFRFKLKNPLYFAFFLLHSRNPIQRNITHGFDVGDFARHFDGVISRKLVKRSGIAKWNDRNLNFSILRLLMWKF